MNTTPKNSPLRSKIGFVMPTVIIMTMVSAVALAAYLKLSIQNSQISRDNVARLKAKNTAEMLIEYAAADLSQRFNTRTNFSENELQPSEDPIVIPKRNSFFIRKSDIIEDSLDIRAGTIQPEVWMFLSPDNPIYEFDPFKNMRVLTRSIDLFSKATVKSNTGNQVTSYASERFVIRDAPLFSHAIFYNSDLEMKPGFGMDVYGSIHANGNIYLGANSGYSVRIFDKITSAKKIIHGEILNPNPSGTVQLASDVDPTIFKSTEIASGDFMDSNHPDWLEMAESRWNGFVQDEALGANVQNVIAFNDYVPDDPYTSVNERDNNSYGLIEPLLPVGHSNRKSTEVRAQKMAYKASLIFKVTPTGVAAFTPRRTNPTVPTSPPKLNSTGDLILDPVTLPPDIIGNPNNDFTSIESSGFEFYEKRVETVETAGWRWFPGTGWRWVIPSENITTNDVIGGLYDHREDRQVDTLAIDIERLKHYIDNNDNSSTGFDGSFNVTQKWNGVIYIEFPTSNVPDSTNTYYTYGTSSGLNSYKIVPAADAANNNERALMIIDAKEIPDPAGALEPGFTIATNAPTYLVGSFNADGVRQPDGAVMPDDADELPAAIFADSLTFLSDNWENNRIHSSLDGYWTINTKRTAADYMEVSAGIVTGSPITIPNGAPFPSTDPNKPNSLGVINLPRFLEFWGANRTLTIRGSLVSMFESEVRPDGAPNNFNNYYVPPFRDWGYSNLFAEGKFPPGTPMIRNSRRMRFQELTAIEYEEAIAALP